MGPDSPSQRMTATNTEVLLKEINTLTSERYPFIKAIGVKTWNRLSKSTQAITEEISKLAKSKDDYPCRMLTQFDSADFDRFVRDGERQLCYTSLTQGFKVKNDPFSTVPGILVYTRSPQHSDACAFVRECLSGAAIEDRLIRNPGRFVSVRSGRDIPLPGGGGIFEPDLVILKKGAEVPYFIVEVNWLHHSVEDARRQVIGPMERYRGKINCGMVLYPLENEWRAEVYRYVNKATGGDDIYLPDGIENQEGERVLMRKALSSSQGDFAIYLQENRAYTLLSSRNPCEDVPLSMFDLFDDRYEHVALEERLRRPNATFWLDHNVFSRIFSMLPPDLRRNAARPRGD